MFVELLQPGTYNENIKDVVDIKVDNAKKHVELFKVAAKEENAYYMNLVKHRLVDSASDNSCKTLEDELDATDIMI